MGGPPLPPAAPAASKISWALMQPRCAPRPPDPCPTSSFPFTNVFYHPCLRVTCNPRHVSQGYAGARGDEEGFLDLLCGLMACFSTSPATDFMGDMHRYWTKRHDEVFFGSVVCILYIPFVPCTLHPLLFLKKKPSEKLVTTANETRY